MPKNEEFDWLDDPFDDKKAAHDQVQSSSHGAMKAFILVVILVVVVAVILLLVFTGLSMLDILAQ